MTRRIGVIGSNNVDLVVTADRSPEAGETLAGRSFAIGQGGKGANQAVAAAKLGGDVVFVSRVGDDSFGDGVLADLAASGVDVTHVRKARGLPNGVASIVVEPSGENRILIVEGANGALTSADVDAAGAELQECGLILLQLEVPLATVRHAIAWGAEHGVEVLLNPAPAIAGLDIATLLPLAFLVPNQTELSLLTGMPAATRAEAEAAARALVARGIKSVIVTLGAGGALLVGDGPAVHVPAVSVVPRDTTGAGDAFVGAFAQRYAKGAGVVEAMEWAAAYAADAITRDGARAAYADAEGFAAFRRGIGEC